MKKVLIWDTSFKLANVGGPAGYLYNIHEYLKQHPNPQITFLSDIMPSTTDKAETEHTPQKSLKNTLLNNALIKTINNILFVCKKSYTKPKISLPEYIDLNSYDIIHFHQAIDATRNRIFLKNYKGKTILTNHCPSPRTDEVLSLNPSWYKVFRPIMLKQEINAYKTVDYLMFPCKGAREPYEKEPQIKEIFQQIEDKFFYVPSAIMDIPVDTKKMQKLSLLGIPEDAFVITYFGRHNDIKGYDILKQIGEDLLNKYNNLYFLCAGRGPIEPLNHPRWIELGFINNTHELLWQSDLYILPNRETYFDLVVLEILRSGTPLLLADNGGNSFFKTLPQHELLGLRFFDVNNLQSIIDQTTELIELKIGSPNKYLELGNANINLWKNRFTLATYINNYIESINKI